MTANRFTTSRRSMLLAAGGLAVLPGIARAQTPGATPTGGTPPAVTPNPDITGSINVGMVGNPQMIALQEIVNQGYFNQAYPNITVNLTVLPENEIRTSINQDVAAQGGAYDAVTISNFEVPLWAANDWLTELGAAAKADPTYDFADILPAHLQGLTYEDGVYALPFYGESAMLYYRKDVLQDMGLTLPDDPTWTQIADLATQIKSGSTTGMSGIALRGLVGWGQQLAPMTTVINAFGGSWYDESWNATLDSEASAKAINFYINTLQQAGPTGVRAERLHRVRAAVRHRPGRDVVRRDVGGGLPRLPGAEPGLLPERGVRPAALRELHGQPGQLALQLGLWRPGLVQGAGGRRRLRPLGHLRPVLPDDQQHRRLWPRSDRRPDLDVQRPELPRGGRGLRCRRFWKPSSSPTRTSPASSPSPTRAASSSGSRSSPTLAIRSAGSSPARSSGAPRSTTRSARPTTWPTRRRSTAATSKRPTAGPGWKHLGPAVPSHNLTRALRPQASAAWGRLSH